MIDYYADPQLKALGAALAEIDAALRDPTEHDIPLDKRGSFVERLGVVKEMIWKLHGPAASHGHYNLAAGLKMLADKVDGIASDLADESKGESDA